MCVPGVPPAWLGPLRQDSAPPDEGPFYLKIHDHHVLFAVQAFFLSKQAVRTQMLFQISPQDWLLTAVMGTLHNLEQALLEVLLQQKRRAGCTCW